jgi:nicotinamidase-related amidase
MSLFLNLPDGGGLIAMSDAPNLHGDELQQSAVALLLIDVINDLEFPEGADLLRHAIPMAKTIAALRARAEQARVPIIYVNDNFGRWRSDFQAQVRHCLHENVRGQPIARLLEPGSDHYFVLKPRHSAFYSTVLEVLLKHLGVRTLILTGIAGNNCILFTANDAYLREMRLIIPSDCVASNTAEENRHALEMMKQLHKADIAPSTRLTTERLRTLVDSESLSPSPGTSSHPDVSES